MKKIIFFIFIFSISLSISAQLNRKTDKENQVSVDLCGPVALAAEFYPNHYSSLNAGSEMSNRSHLIGFSLSYARKVKEVKIGYRVGVIAERVNDEIENAAGVKETLSIHQNHYLNTIFMVYEEDIKKIIVRFRAELPFVWHGNYQEKYYYYHPATQLTFDDRTTFSQGLSTGLGLGMGLGIKTNDKLTFGVDLSEYLLYSRFSGNYEQTINDSFGGSPMINNGTYSTKTTFTQWGFSKLAPRIFLAIGF